MKTDPENHANLIASCGLFCANCGKYKRNKCPGCRENTKATWCKIRSCCMEKHIANCSFCTEFKNPRECMKYNNLISRIIEYFTSTDRSLCITFIRDQGEAKFQEIMSENNQVSLSRSK